MEIEFHRISECQKYCNISSCFMSSRRQDRCQKWHKSPGALTVGNMIKGMTGRVESSRAWAKASHTGHFRKTGRASQEPASCQEHYICTVLTSIMGFISKRVSETIQVTRVYSRVKCVCIYCICVFLYNYNAIFYILGSNLIFTKSISMI